jgi:Transcriptional regulator
MTAVEMKSLLRSLRVLEAVAERQPVAVGELARELGLPKSTVQRMLLTFHEAGWLRQVRGDVTRWEVSARILAVRPAALKGGHLYTAARGPMAELRDATNETVHLSVLDDLNCMVLIDRVDCDQVVRTFSPIGDMSPLHSTSIGKAVLAHLAPRDVEEVIARGLERHSPTTITDPDELRRELADIRKRGYSVNRGEYRPAVCAIGAAILDAEASPVAGICISMPESRFHPDRGAALGRTRR